MPKANHWEEERLFAMLCDDTEALLYNCDIRRHSRVKVLQGAFEMKEEISIFK
jgi:hypothetical protein